MCDHVAHMSLSSSTPEMSSCTQGTAWSPQLGCVLDRKETKPRVTLKLWALLMQELSSWVAAGADGPHFASLPDHFLAGGLTCTAGSGPSSSGALSPPWPPLPAYHLLPFLSAISFTTDLQTVLGAWDTSSSEDHLSLPGLSRQASDCAFDLRLSAHMAS